MPETKSCSACGGSGVRTYLKNAHGDETEVDTCNVCQGRKNIHYMTDEEEDDYRRYGNADW
jgi:DnaJ-class molecular chaperone